jgi:hypothetical protein
VAQFSVWIRQISVSFRTTIDSIWWKRSVLRVTPRTVVRRFGRSAAARTSLRITCEPTTRIEIRGNREQPAENLGSRWPEGLRWNAPNGWRKTFRPPPWSCLGKMRKRCRKWTPSKGQEVLWPSGKRAAEGMVFGWDELVTLTVPGRGTVRHQNELVPIMYQLHDRLITVLPGRFSNLKLLRQMGR